MSKSEYPPPSRIVSFEEIMVFFEKTKELLNNCIDQLQPAKNLKAQIKLGLLTKELKTYSNIFRITVEGDGDTPPILARVLFEITLTFIFLIINEDEDPTLFNLFKKTALQRTYNQLIETKKSETANRKSAKEAIKSLNNTLEKENFNTEEDISDKFPKSWHPDLSYYKMAKNTGGEFEDYYKIFYDSLSIFTHPNWLDLKNNHLVMKNSRAKSRIVSPASSVILLSIVTCLVLRTVEICAMKLTGSGKTKNVELVNKTRKLHHELHNK